MTSSPASLDPEPPECPVCLQPYDGEVTIPRVLGCGHSACEVCLAQLPRPPSLSSAVARCPACTQLVKLTHPTSLPKNIDLLRYSLSSPPNPHPKRKPPSPPRRNFPPQLFSPELYGYWKHWVLPKGAVLMDKQVGCGRFRFDLGDLDVGLGLNVILRSRLIDDQEVGLVEIGRFGVEEEGFEYSYVGKVMGVLGCLSDAQRIEVESLLRVSMRKNRVCGVVGLWLDDGSGLLYLVSERKNGELLSLGDLGGKVGHENEGFMSYLSVIGVELCEALICLELEALVCGCLDFSCLRFDEFGHMYIDLSEVVMSGRRIRERVLDVVNGKRKMEGAEVMALAMDLLRMDVFISLEVLLEMLRGEGIEIENYDAKNTVDHSSDVWLFACVLLRLIIGNQFAKGKQEGASDWKTLYMQCIKTISSTWETLLATSHSTLRDILLKCLDLDSAKRPLITDVWKSIRGSGAYCFGTDLSSLNRLSIKDNTFQCLVLGELCNVSDELRKESAISGLNERDGDSQVKERTVNAVVEGLSAGRVHCKDLQGHLDCVTNLCVGGGFLFSSSFDKTINMWSLQDFTHVHTFRGHEHRVMAMVFIHQEKPLCISADNGGGIFFWEIMPPFGQESVKKWYEEKDWRYSGIHALAISESGYLYTGSGDRLIKAWSLRDYTLICSMEGHKSVVCTLALCNGVLYSGSWDGTVRLWCLHDHTPLAVFGEGMPGRVSSVLSLHADQNTVIAALENGCIKIWVNDELRSSRKVHDGAIFAVSKEERWVFTGGWDKSVKVQEISIEEMEMETREVGSVPCDSVITALLYTQGMLFVGCANKLIKVYLCEC